MATQDDIKER